MGKRTFSILLALALVAGVFSALPARAQEPAPVAIPETVQIDDPVGDANGVNDQDNAYGTPLAGEGDHVGPAGGTATDIRKVWFTNTATEVSLNIQLNGNPGNLAYDTYFRFSSNAGEGPVASDTTRGCLQWVASVNGAAGAYDGETEGVITDKCNTGEAVVGPLVIAPGTEGFVITITFPRSASPLFADGQKLTAPFGVSRVLYVGPSPTTATAATLDNTKRGTDYVITGGGPVVRPAPEPKEEPPGKSDPPGKGKKKGCKKGKGKKKGACPGKPDVPKPPVVPACSAYVPGEAGAEVETTIVTDAATEEKPVEVPIEAGAGIGVGGNAATETFIAHAFQNVQVDSAAASTGLYVRLEMPYPSDYDLYVRNPDDSEAARAAGFNPEPAVYNDNTAGGHTEADAEQIDGVRSADCQGYTIDVATATGEGGELTLKFWLGEATYPAEPGGGEALRTFYSLLGI